MDLRGVERGDAKVDRAVDRARRFVDVGRFAIKDVAALDHRHTADANRGDFEAVAELAIFHGVSPKGTFRSEEHTSELQSLMRISYAVFCLKKKSNTTLKT